MWTPQESMQPRENGEDANDYSGCGSTYGKSGKGIPPARFRLPTGQYPVEMEKGAKSEPYGKGTTKGGYASVPSWGFSNIKSNLRTVFGNSV